MRKTLSSSQSVGASMKWKGLESIDVPGDLAWHGPFDPGDEASTGEYPHHVPLVVRMSGTGFKCPILYSSFAQ